MYKGMENANCDWQKERGSGGGGDCENNRKIIGKE